MLTPIFRLLVWLGAFRWFVRHQRLVHTFVTNLRGPAERMAMLGVPIVDVILFTMISGNIPVAFAALSYADSVTVTIITDPAAMPDLEILRRALQAELDRLTADATPGT